MRNAGQGGRIAPSILALVVVTAGWTVGTGDWAVDADHSQVGFTARHLFTPVRGGFDRYEIRLDYDAESPENSRVEVSIDVASVDTGNLKRDAALLAEDWFHVSRWPTITFRSTEVRRAGPDRLIAEGELTIRDVTRPVELPIELLGVRDIPEELRETMAGARQVAGFHTTLTVDRRDFGVGSGSWAETAIVPAEVEIEIAVEAMRR